MSKGTEFLKPADGRRVRKPDGVLLNEQGEFIDTAPDATFWFRRLADGDVTPAAPSKRRGESE